MQALEERVGLRFLSRTTRAVAVTEAQLAVRHVLGATRKALVQSLLREALCTGLVGLSIGWVFAVVGAHLLRASLHGVPVVDLGGVLMVSSAIAAGVLLASAPTARRAARLQPVEILRRL